MIRFADFEFDAANAILRKDGVPVRLRPQAVRILALLVEARGQLVARDRIRQEVWGSETFVDFNQGLNVCIRQIRDALGDSAEAPRFIETVPKLGYRFIARIEGQERGAEAPDPTRIEPPAAAPRERPPVGSRGSAHARRRRVGVALALAGVTVAAMLAIDWPSRQRADTRTIRSLAVLPLANGSATDEDYFVDGITDALISDLAQIRALKVISRTSVMQYKAKPKPLPEIGRELGVDAIVEGSVHRLADRVRVNVQLVDTLTDHHIWAQTYERELTDILTLQRDLARAVAVAVRAVLTPEEQSRLSESRTVAPEVFEAYLKGRYHRGIDSPESRVRARSHYEEALRLDPDYALAHVALAELFVVLGMHGELPADVAFPAARQSAARALQIDDRLGEPYVALAAVRTAYDRDWVGGEQYFTRALERAPNYAQAHAWYAEYLTGVARPDDAVAAILKARQLDPLSPVIQQTTIRVMHLARDYDGMLRHTRTLEEMFGADAETYRFSSMALLGQRHPGDALAQAERAVAVSGGTDQDADQSHFHVRDAMMWLAYVHATLGRREPATRVLQQFQTPSTPGPIAYDLAAIHAALGQRDEAVTLLERARANRYMWLQRVHIDPRFDPLRGDARFEQFRERIAQEDGIQLR